MKNNNSKIMFCFLSLLIGIILFLLYKENSMANIDKVQLPDGSEFNIVDNTSHFATENYVDNAVDSITKTTIGLGNVDNTSDLNKPVSTAQQTAINTKVPKQDTRKYLLIFDSYGALGVSTIAQQACSSSHVLNVGGAGFVGAGGGSTWGDALTTYAQSITEDERATFTDIMIFGGINDYSFTASAVITAIGNFKSLCDTYFPNAEITLAPISWATRLDGTYKEFVDQTLYAYSTGCAENDIRFVVGLNAYIHNDKYMSSDGIHPNSDGVSRLGNAVKNFIKTGVVAELYTSAESATVTYRSGWSSPLTYIETAIRGDSVNLTGWIVMQTNTAEQIPSGGNQAFHLFNITNSNFYGIITGYYPSHTITTAAYIHDVTNNTWKLIPATIQIYYGKVYLCIEGGSINADAIQTTTFSITADLQSA